MEKPYVVCHMLTSLDGKIDGAYMSDPACAPALTAYGELRKTFDCQATIYGTTTMRGSYSDWLCGELTHCDTDYGWEDFVAPSDVQNYIVSVDPDGILGWNSCYIEKKGRPRAHVIEVLTEQVSNDYLGYLRERGVSYIFAGKKGLDCALLLHKLKTLFGIERLMVAGGGVMNWSFVQENLLDEVSIVVAPVADGSTSAVSVFERADFQPERKPAVFAIKEVERLQGGALWMRYVMKQTNTEGYT